MTHLKRPWCLERLRAGGEGEDRGWDGWMASLAQWTWVWVDSGSWWWIGRPGVLWFMGLQRVGQDWETELNWTSTTNIPVKVAMTSGCQIHWSVFHSNLTALSAAIILGPSDPSLFTATFSLLCFHHTTWAFLLRHCFFLFSLFCWVLPDLWMLGAPLGLVLYNCPSRSLL